MIFSKFKLFGLLVLSYPLIACGQTQATTPNTTPSATSSATSSAIAQTTTATQATQTPIAEKSPEAVANGHSLVNSFKGKLESLGIKIALPTYVPQGFWIAAVRTEPCRQGDTVDANGVCRFGPDYTVIYRNSQDHCFTVEATGGGLGGPSSRYTRAVRSKIFDKVDVMIGTGNDQPITDAIANTPQELRTDYAGNSPFYAVRTIKSQAASRIDAAIICSDTVHMTPNEFIKIVESLDWLPQSTSSVSSAPPQEKMAQQSTDVDAETLHQTFKEISEYPCTRKRITEKSTVYSICTALAGYRGAPWLFSAGSGNTEGGGGITYWYHTGSESWTEIPPKVAAIQFDSNGQLFMFDRSSKLQAELIRDQARSIRTNFDQAERDRLEKLAQEGGADILSRFR